MGVTPQVANAMTASAYTGTHGAAASADDSASSEQRVTDHRAGTGSEEPDGESGAGLLGLCLAVLAGLLLGIALLLARRGFPGPRTLLPAWQPPVFIGRDREPPGLRTLRVIRC